MIAVIEVKPPGAGSELGWLDAGTHDQVRSVEVHNAGSEVIKSIHAEVVQKSHAEVVQESTGTVVVPLYRTHNLVQELLLSHLEGGAKHRWNNVRSAPIAKAKAADGSKEMRADLGPRITWTDAAGWRWQMTANREPIRLD
ncbi:hypothetical protein GCM10010428_00330 [Actinosynnema pretiosum subsp. pretiosum]